MSGAYSLSPALPSPPAGVPAAAGTLGLRLRRAMLAHITPEPSDLPGRIAVAAVLGPSLLGCFLPAFGTPFWAVHNQLFQAYMSLWAPLTFATIFGGLASRSRTARALAILSVATLAVVSGATRLGVPLPLMASLVGWVLPAATKATLGIWVVRALRRRLDPGGA